MLERHVHYFRFHEEQRLVVEKYVLKTLAVQKQSVLASGVVISEVATAKIFFWSLNSKNVYHRQNHILE